MAFKYPDRWLNYTNFGAQVEGTPFVPLKVPLKQDFFKNREKESFTPADVVEQLPDLGLVIDLTFTKRYYDPKDFREKNVDHKKIFTKGHEVPQRSLVNKFIHIVDTFLRNEQNKDKLIGVHCTHGLNRTGYFVCAYMILAQGRYPRDTINVFNKARYHQMERANYLNSLLTLRPEAHGRDERRIGEPRATRDDYRRDDGHSHKHKNGRYSYAEGSGNWRRDRSPIDFQRSGSRERQNRDHRENRRRRDDNVSVRDGERSRQNESRRKRSNQCRSSREDRHA